MVFLAAVFLVVFFGVETLHVVFFEGVRLTARRTAVAAHPANRLVAETARLTTEVFFLVVFFHTTLLAADFLRAAAC